MNQPSNDPLEKRVRDLELLLEDYLDVLHRAQELEACLVYVRNFLPAPLKARAEEVLWPDVETGSQPADLEHSERTVTEP